MLKEYRRPKPRSARRVRLCLPDPNPLVEEEKQKNETGEEGEEEDEDEAEEEDVEGESEEREEECEEVEVEEEEDEDEDDEEEEDEEEEEEDEEDEEKGERIECVHPNSRPRHLTHQQLASLLYQVLTNVLLRPFRTCRAPTLKLCEPAVNDSLPCPANTALLSLQYVETSSQFWFLSSTKQ